MAGHLFGYEAALAIDAQARPLREARARPSRRPSAARLDRRRRPAAGRPARRARGCGRAVLRRPAQRRLRRPPRGQHRGAARLAVPLRRSASLPLEAYQVEHGKVGTPSVVIEDLTAALTRAIEELTRPVDAIKHQAKTVTVGISRSDESLLQVPLVPEVLATRRGPRPAHLRLAAHAGRPRPGGRRGARLHPLPHRGPGRRRGQATRRSWSTAAASRASSRRAPTRNPQLRGTKHRVATERQVTVGRGPQRRAHARDRPRDQGQPVPRASPCCTCASTTTCPRPAMRSVLQGYRGRLLGAARTR